MFAKWRHLSNNVVLVPQVLTTGSDAVRAASSTLPANGGMFSRTLQTLKHLFLCLICPELLHSYHNCNMNCNVPANGGMFSRTLQTLKHLFLCLICPELLHSYHNCNMNCNVDSFFVTDEQFQYGMNVDFNQLTNAHFRHSS